MGFQTAAEGREFMVCDIRGKEKDSIYEMAVELSGQLMNGLCNLQHTATIEAAMLFITHSRAHLIILAKSDDSKPITAAFRNTLSSTTFDYETGHLQKYTIPILETPDPC